MLKGKFQQWIQKLILRVLNPNPYLGPLSTSYLTSYVSGVTMEMGTARLLLLSNTVDITSHFMTSSLSDRNSGHNCDHRSRTVYIKIVCTCDVISSYISIPVLCYIFISSFLFSVLFTFSMYSFLKFVVAFNLFNCNFLNKIIILKRERPYH